LISLENVKREYRMGTETVHAVAGVDLNVADGEFLALVGPSGSGKSTLLHLVGGLDRPSSGKVSVDGQDVGKAGDRELSRYRNKKVGFIFQAFNLHPTFNALENVAIPLIFAGVSKKERLKRAEQALDEVGLSKRLKHLPNQLSGGERQRVSIARALVVNPKLIIADEPTGNLDSKTGNLIMELLGQLNRGKGITMVVATHDAELAWRAGRVIHLRDGVIVSEERGSH
jgi:putative ABC transport system ATP-binding protein